MCNEVMQPIGTLPKFDRLVRPLDKDERDKLKEELLQNVDSRVIRTWRGKHLLDRERYELCAELSLKVTISEQYFEDWIGAAEYICLEQLKKIEQGSKFHKYLMGQLLQYRIERNREQDNTERKVRIAEEIGKEWELSGAAVSKYCTYANALNDIFSQSEEMAGIVLSEKVSISHENVLELSHLKGEEIRAIAKAVEADNVAKITLSFIRNEVKLCHMKERGVVTRKEKQENELAQHAGIRQMPEYDPDSGVNSLCMTIESWISSIQRVRYSDDFELISNKACLRLMKKMTGLEYIINEVQETLVERTNL